MRMMEGLERYAVVSCHAERLTDDRVWAALERVLRRRPGGFVITPFLRPPVDAEDEQLWLERARIASSLAPVGHHTHWTGPEHARPVEGIDTSGVVRREAEWLREHGLDSRFFCGGGWYIDCPVTETLAELGYVDCTATAFCPEYLDEGAQLLKLDDPANLQLPSGARLLELPATHSLGMLSRGLLRVRGLVHLHFHDWELVDRRRLTALETVLRLLRLRRRPLTVSELALRAATAPEVPWPGG
jgi:hypothetical protein